MNDSVEADSTQEHQRLRQLILGKKQTQKLDDLRPEVERVSEVISEAIKDRNKKDNSLGRALSPSLETALQDAIEKNPKSIIDTLFPIITPALRKAINSAMAEMLLSFNQVLEKGLSPKFISWRFQAWRAGKSFAEFILLKTIKYRVEQVILIDRQTSLVMALKTAPEVKTQDAEQVSAMLSAISDFVNESFNSNNQAGLETIRSGDFVLELASSPSAILVAAVRGVNSIQIKQQLGKTLEELHVQHHKQIQSFNGERLEDEHIDALLGDCLLEQRTQEEVKPRKPWLAIFIILLLISTFGYYTYLQWHWSNQAGHIIERINHEKGYLLTQHKRTSNHLNLTLLRSPSSADIEQIIEPVKNDLDIEVKQSYAPIDDSSFFLPYLKKQLNLNSKHTLTSYAKRLKIQGRLTQEQVKNIANQNFLGQLFEEVEVEKQAAKFHVTPSNGVTIIYNLQTTYKPIKNGASETKIKELVQELNQLHVLFPFNAIKLDFKTNTALQKAVKLCKQIKAISDSRNQLFPDLIIMGFSDNTTKDSIINQKISLQRAKFVQSVLINNGIPETSMMISAMANLKQSSLSHEQQRRVSFHTIYAPLKSTGNSE